MGNNKNKVKTFNVADDFFSKSNETLAEENNYNVAEDNNSNEKILNLEKNNYIKCKDNNTQKNSKKIKAKELYEKKGYYSTKSISIKLKIASAQSGVDMSSIIRAAINEYIDNHTSDEISILLKNK